MAGRISHIPVVAHVHAMNSKHCYQCADGIICCTFGVKKHLVQQGLAAEKIKVVYYGIDMHRFENIPEKNDMRRLLNLPVSAPVVGCVAHLSAKKGQEFLLRAIALLKDNWPDLQCLLVGEGTMGEQLRGLATELGIASRIHLLGFRPDAIAVMNAMDLVVLPSIAKEGLGLVLIEGALLKKATIASNAPGIDEALVDGVTGLLVQPGSPEHLAQALDRLLTDSGLRESMGEAGRLRALSTFTIPAMTDGVEAVYRELVAA
jgi:glycosyltransferase involved in cell wall biosynthesis